jgi:AcrR family transcriptional regulator
VYQYFSSGADILACVIEDSFPRSNESMQLALVGASGPSDVVQRFVRELLRQAAQGAHLPAAALAAAQIPKECLVRLGELHREQIAPFIDALKSLDVAELEITARLLGGALEAAMGAIESGACLETVTERTLALVRSVVPDIPLSQRNR